MRRTAPTEIEALLRVDAPTRYSYFVKRVVDSELAWGLWNNGWALMRGEGEEAVFPLWPEREYAELCATGEWAGYTADEIGLSDLVNELLPRLAEREVRPGVFPTPTGKGITVTTAELIESLRAELQKYE